jgi:hypothetical protein
VTRAWLLTIMSHSYFGVNIQTFHVMLDKPMRS